MSSPFFSIIVPCFNAEKYIKACIDSVLAQSFDDWEVVIVDDGSTDSSALIIDRMQESYPEKIIVIHQDNHGQLLSRRAAIDKARGEYIVYLDADDALRADALEILHDIYNEHPNSIIQFQYSTKPDFASARRPVFPEKFSRPVVKDIGWLRRQVCTGYEYNNLWGKAFPRDSVNCEEDFNQYAFMRNGEDVLQLVAILDYSLAVVLVNECLYYYRENPDSITHTFQPGYYASVKVVNNALHEHAKNWGDESLSKLLDVRWVNTSIGAIKKLLFSPYKLPKLADEIKLICEDEGFIRSVNEGCIDSANARDTMLIQLAKRRSYKVMAVIVAFARLVLA